MSNFNTITMEYLNCFSHDTMKSPIQNGSGGDV